MIDRHQAVMRNGYSVPVTMAWMFWPIGQNHFIEIETPMRDEVTGEFIKARYVNPILERARIERQFTVTNHDAWMARLVELRAVRTV